MEKFHLVVMRAALILILLLISFSIYGAFLGPDNARVFFNSPPLISYWLILVFILIVGFINFPKPIRTGGPLLMHLGCILILAAAMYGSEAGGRIQKKIFGIDKIHRGLMLIYVGQENNQVILENSSQISGLPFSIKLKGFRIEYYEPGHTVRDYISSLAVIINGQTIAEKNVEVNRPLHFGGYYFYQHSYDRQAAQYTILSVVSDSGLPAICAGYLMLGAGVFWHFWLKSLLGK